MQNQYTKLTQIQKIKYSRATRKMIKTSTTEKFLTQSHWLANTVRSDYVNWISELAHENNLSQKSETRLKNQINNKTHISNIEALLNLLQEIKSTTLKTEMIEKILQIRTTKNIKGLLTLEIYH